MSPKQLVNPPNLELSEEARGWLPEAIRAEQAKLLLPENNRWWQTSTIRDKLFRLLEQALGDPTVTTLHFGDAKDFVFRSVMTPEQIELLSDATSELWLRNIRRQWMYIVAWIDLHGTEQQEDLPVIGE